MRPRDRGSQRTLDVLADEHTMGRAPQPCRLLRQLRASPRRHHPARPLEFAVDAVVENSEPRRRRLSEWEQDALAGDPRLEFVLPSPRVPIAGNTRSLWREWNGTDTSFDSVLATAQRIPRELRYVSGATTVEFEHRRSPCGRRRRLPGLHPPLPRDGSWSRVAGPLRERLPRSSRRGAGRRGSVTRLGRGVRVRRSLARPRPDAGTACRAHHLRLAVGRDYGDVAPHHGLFFGTATGAAPEVTVRIARMSNQQVEHVEHHAAVHWQQQQQQQ